MKFYVYAQSNEKLEEIFSKQNFNEDVKNYLRSLDINNRGIALKTIFRNPEANAIVLIELIKKEIDKQEKKSLITVHENKNKLDLLIDIYPNQKEKIKSLPRKYQEWLINRFGKDSLITETHPLSDCVGILISYSNKENGLLDSYLKNKNNFKDDVDSALNKDIKNINNLSSDDMVKIMEIYSSGEALEIAPKNLEGDKVGKVGEWNIWLPSSRENSITIAGYNKLKDGKLQPKTTWCTARIYNSNLFYNYIGGTGGNFMLFYIIKDNPTGKNDFLSLGFENKEPILPSEYGGASVNRDNEGLNQEKLKNILGNSYQEIMDAIYQKVGAMNGKSPAYVKIEEAAQDVIKFNKLIEKNSEEEKKIIYEEIIKNPKITKDVFLEMIKKSKTFKDKDNIKFSIIKNKNCPEDILQILVNDEEINVRAALARHTKSEKILAQLVKNPYRVVNEILINKAITTDILKLIYEKYKNVTDFEAGSILSDIAKNPKTSQEILSSLFFEKNNKFKNSIYLTLAENKNTPATVLTLIYELKNHEFNRLLARNPSTPENILIEFSKNNELREYIAENEKAPENILKEFLNEKNEYALLKISSNRGAPPDIIRNIFDFSQSQINNNFFKNKIIDNLSTNPACPADILEKILNDYFINPDGTAVFLQDVILFNLSSNPSSSKNILTYIYNTDSSFDIRYNLSANINTPIEILEKLSEDEYIEIKTIAQETLKKVRNVTANNKYNKVIKLSSLYYKKCFESIL